MTTNIKHKNTIVSILLLLLGIIMVVISISNIIKYSKPNSTIKVEAIIYDHKLKESIDDDGNLDRYYKVSISYEIDGKEYKREIDMTTLPYGKKIEIEVDKNSPDKVLGNGFRMGLWVILVFGLVLTCGAVKRFFK